MARSARFLCSLLAPLVLAPLAAKPTVTVQAGGELVRNRWVQVLSLAPGAQPKSFGWPDGVQDLSLEGVPPGLALLCAGAERRATVCRRLTLEEGAPASIGGPVEGVRVTGGVRMGRKPAAGAQISVLLHPLPIRKGFLFPLARVEGKGPLSFVTRVESDEHGRFVLPFLAPGDYRLDVHFPSGRSEQGQPFTVPSPESLRATKPRKEAQGPPVFDLGELAVPEGLELQMEVVDRQGRPIPRAGVSVRQGDPRLGSTAFHGKADAAGLALLSGLAPQAMTASCSAPGYLLWQKEIDLFPGRVRCVLTKHSGLTGRIVDEEEEPVPGVTVTARLAERSAVTDREGTFSFDNLGAGGYDLTMAAPGYKALEKRVQIVPEERLVLPPVTMRAAEAFHGKVVDGSTGEAVSGAAVTVVNPPGGGRAVSDDEGHFALRSDAEGSLSVEVESARYPPSTFEIEKERRRIDDAEPPVLEIFPGGRIRARVWDEKTDSPCLGCTLSISLPGSLRRLPLVATDSTGEAVTLLLQPGRYSVSLDDVESLGSMVRVRSGNNVRAVTVEPGKTAEVEFGEKRESVEVAFVPPLPGGWRLQARGGGKLEIYPPQPDGTFRIQKPHGEALRLILGSLDGDFQVLAATLPADFEKAYLSLPLSSTAVTATIARQGEPLAQARVDFISATDNVNLAWGSTRADGSFSASFLPPGAYRLEVEGRAVQTVEVEEGMALDLGLVQVAPQAGEPTAP